MRLRIARAAALVMVEGGDKSAIIAQRVEIAVHDVGRVR